MARNCLLLGLPVTTTVFNNKNGTGEYGFGNNVCVGQDQKVLVYDKTRKAQFLNGVDIGFFLVDKKIINPREEGNFSFEEVNLNRLVREHKVGAFMTDEQYYYITSLESLRQFENVAKTAGSCPLSATRSDRHIFLCRNGSDKSGLDARDFLSAYIAGNKRKLAAKHSSIFKRRY